MITTEFLILYIWLFLLLAVGIGILVKLRFPTERVSDAHNRTIQHLKERDRAFRAMSELNAIVLETLDFEIAAQRIADAIPAVLGYETGVLALVDESKGVLKRVSISKTPGGKAALGHLEIPFSTIEIDLKEKKNYCVRALNGKKPLRTTNLYDVLRPVVTPENSKIVQDKMHTKTTLIFPLFTKENKPFGTFLVSIDKHYDEISTYEHQTLENFVDGIQIVLRNAMMYTSLANTKEKLQQANARLKDLDLLKNEFVSMASHELRTPMTAIKSYMWMVLEGRGGPITEKQRFYLKRAYASVDRLIKLVNDMLNISRIESGRLSVAFDSVRLEDVVQEVIYEVLPRAKELDITVTLAPFASLPHVLADADKIKEVLFNFVGNSLKFTPKKGKVTLCLERKGDYVDVRVSDTGVGISLENQPKLFKKFNMLPESYAGNQSAMGTGLGLYICKSIIKLHGGKIWMQSEGSGKGSEFGFSVKVFNEKDFQEFKHKFATRRQKELGIIHTQI